MENKMETIEVKQLGLIQEIEPLLERLETGKLLNDKRLLKIWELLMDVKQEFNKS